MGRPTEKLFVLLILLCPLSAVARAASAPALVNWSASATDTPSASQSRIRALNDISNPVPFIATAPCRQYNSLSATPLLQGVNRAVLLTGAPCGISASAVAVSVNITVFNITGATGNGVFKVDTVTPPAVAWINYPATETQRGNAGIVALNQNGQIIVQIAQGAGQVDFVVDTNGYYSPSPANLGNTFTLLNNSASYTYFGQNGSATCTGPCGLFQGVNSGTAIDGYSATNGDGVFGLSNDASGAGVHGVLTSAVPGSRAVWGEHQSTTSAGIGVYGSHAHGGIGVLGQSLGATGVGPGVQGIAFSNDFGAAGVLGQALSTTAFEVFGVEGTIATTASNLAAGVYGFTNSVSGSAGRFSEAGINTFLGTQVSGVDYGVYSFTSRLLGGSLVIVGAPKSFASPHPENPGLEIRYASVEAPTVDVYFRGTAELVNGYARIDIPDHFRFTARENTYMTTLTAVGRPVGLGVESEGPEGIVVRGSGNGRFHYVVYAERAEIENFHPVMRNETFTPEALRKGSLKGLPATTKALLVKNKTINSDGSYNEDTARAQGWAIPTPEATAPPTPQSNTPQQPE